MVVLNKIYTKSGDDGSTGLAAGPRRQKHDLRVAAYGTVDEANAAIGMVCADRDIRSEMNFAALASILARIQNDLFDLGADLATPEPPEPPEQPEKPASAASANPAATPLRIRADQVSALEQDIDTLNAGLAPLRSFVLPGGTPAAAALHLARTIARRAERLIWQLAQDERVNRQTMIYMNRLSDLLFVAARYVNTKGKDPEGDVLWRPGGTASGDASKKQ